MHPIDSRNISIVKIWHLSFQPARELSQLFVAVGGPAAKAGQRKISL